MTTAVFVQVCGANGAHLRTAQVLELSTAEAKLLNVRAALRHALHDELQQFNEYRELLPCALTQVAWSSAPGNPFLWSTARRSYEAVDVLFQTFEAKDAVPEKTFVPFIVGFDVQNTLQPDADLPHVYFRFTLAPTPQPTRRAPGSAEPAPKARAMGEGTPAFVNAMCCVFPPEDHADLVTSFLALMSTPVELPCFACVPPGDEAALSLQRVTLVGDQHGEYDQLSALVTAAVAANPASPKTDTEAWYHSVNDACINTPLRQLLTWLRLDVMSARDAQELSLTTKGLRPDFWHQVTRGRALLVKGEEKRQFGDDITVARQELLDKMKVPTVVMMSHAPYMFGFATQGIYVNLYAIHQVDGQLVTSLPVHLSTQTVVDRLKIFATVVNIVRVIRTWDERGLISALPPGTLDTMQRQDGVSLTFLGEQVYKNIPLNAATEAAYQWLKQNKCDFLPEVVQVISTTTYTTVHMRPYGVLAAPSNEPQWRLLAECVLKALHAIHAAGKVHRDVRLPNIIFVRGVEDTADRYILIDLDMVVAANTPWSLQADHQCAPPGYRVSGWTPTFDLWQLGTVLATTPLAWFAKQLMGSVAHNPPPSAADMLSALQSQ